MFPVVAIVFNHPINQQEKAMTRFVEKYGPWAVVTGASSGIGETFARRLAKAGLNVVLVARRERQLKTLANTLEAHCGVQVRIVSVDLSQDDFLEQIRQKTADLEVGLLVNNAGFATNGNFLDNDLEAEVAMLHVNARAPLILAHHFGSLMKKQSKGGIIFISSILGFSGVPSWSNYGATKSFDHILAEGMARELKRHGVSVLAVAPGPTRTHLWADASSRLLPFTMPERVVDVALRKLGRRSSVTVGWLNTLIVFSTRLLPRSCNARIFGVVVRLLKRATASDEDKTLSNNNQTTGQVLTTR
jgi:short-subunit dehydrogenase